MILFAVSSSKLLNNYGLRPKASSSFLVITLQYRSTVGTVFQSLINWLHRLAVSSDNLCRFQFKVIKQSIPLLTQLKEEAFIMADTGSLFSQEGFISGEAIHERIEDVHESADERVVGLLDDEDDLTSNTEELLKQLDDAITTVDDTRAAGSILSSPLKKVAACRSEQGVNVVTPGKLTPAKRATPASNIGILEFPSQQQQMPPQCQQHQQVILAFRALPLQYPQISILKAEGNSEACAP